MAIRIGRIILLVSCFTFFGGISLAASSEANNINRDKVQTTRISRNNQERALLKLKPYTGNSLLNLSATEWSKHLAGLGKASHQRLSGDGYYNYRSIKSWFDGIGIGFQDENGTMFTESLGRGYYKCSKSDCTDSLLLAIKSTWKFFMSEKYKKSKPHYLAIVSKNFSSVGLGVSFSKNKYYLVAHYGKNVKQVAKK